jgi:hypothetical protein
MFRLSPDVSGDPISVVHPWYTHGGRVYHSSRKGLKLRGKRGDPRRTRTFNPEIKRHIFYWFQDVSPRATSCPESKAALSKAA